MDSGTENQQPALLPGVSPAPGYSVGGLGVTQHIVPVSSNYQRRVSAAPGYSVGGLGVTKGISPVSSEVRRKIVSTTRESADSQNPSGVINDNE